MKSFLVGLVAFALLPIILLGGMLFVIGFGIHQIGETILNPDEFRRYYE